MRTWFRAAELLAFTSLAVAGCQYVAGLNEERTTLGLPSNGSGGAGGEGGQGGDSGLHPSRPCVVEVPRRASQGGQGDPSLAWTPEQYRLAWSNFQSGAATSTVDAKGDLSSTEDLVLLGPQAPLSNGQVAIAPFGDELLVGVSRFDGGTGQNYPALFSIDSESGATVTTSDAEAFPSAHMTEAVSLVSTDDFERVLMAMRSVGPAGPTELRRFNGSLTQYADDTIPNTLDATAAWSKELDLFALFVTVQGDPNELKLYTFEPDATDIDDAVLRISEGKETPSVEYFKQGLSAAAADGRFFVAWTDGRHVGDSGVYLASVDRYGERDRDPVWVSDAHPDVATGAPNLIFDGKQLVIVYRTEQRLYMRRFTTDLEAIGEEQFLAELNDAGTERAALVAGAPGNFGVAYLDPETSDYFVFQRIVCDDPW